MEGDLWRLSPAYDLNPFPDRARELKTWISEDAGPDASIRALMDTAPYFGLGHARAAAVLGEVEGGVSDAFAGMRAERLAPFRVSIRRVYSPIYYANQRSHPEAYSRRR